MQGIYTITNTANGKVYVGSSIMISKRWSAHRNLLRRGKHANPHLQSSWVKHGEDTFEFQIVEIVENVNLLAPREQFWLDKCKEVGQVYNMGNDTACPTRGSTLSPEHRAKISAHFKGRVFTKEHLAKIAKARKGWRHTEESKRTMRANQPDRRGKKSSRYGHKHTEETKAKMRASGVDKGAKPYPSFINRVTGEVIPAGFNLSALCRERNLNKGHMWGVINDSGRHSHKDWILADE